MHTLSFKNLCILASVLLSNVFTSYGRFWAICAFAMHLRHPLCVPPAASVFHHISQKRRLSSLWPQIWLLAHALNVLHTCEGTRGVNGRRAGRCLTRDPQRWERQQQHSYPSGDRSVNMTELVVRTLPSPSGVQGPGPDTYKGWLFKWTNYLKGYQRRWFVLSNGLLSYYRYVRCVSFDAYEKRAVSPLSPAVHYLTFFGIGVAQKF